MAPGACVGTLSAIAAAAVLTVPQQSPTFSAKTELVVLHVSVTDARGKHVAGLSVSSFHVVEDGRPQRIDFFAAQDAPVTIGLLIDSSGSMGPIRDRVIGAASAFVASSNPRDEVFALVFNDDVKPVLPEDVSFTGDAALLRHALTQAFAPAGRTALYDAVTQGLRYARSGSLERRALVVLSDGGDNASHRSASAVLSDVQSSSTVIYTVALVDPLGLDADPKMLGRLAGASGGLSFTPRGAAELDAVFAKISNSLRQAYTIGYVPEQRGRGFRNVRVTVDSPEGRRLTARTRSGYRAE